jgi:tRNA (guanine-N7-)-methyltransferase
MASEKSSDKTEGDYTQRGVWVRRQNRGLNPQRQSAMDSVYPHIAIDESFLLSDASLAPSSLFDKPEFPVWMEIGFGGGEHVIGLLEQNPDINIVAIEPFVNGMAAFVKDLPQSFEPRVRVYMDDAVMLARSLADDSVERIYVLNPDPWHKARHHKRRIVRSETLDIYARILKSGGQLIMSSDVPDMVEWMVTHTFNHPAFEWQAECAQDWSTPPEDWITTRYEVKGAKGASKMSYLFFTRK